MEISNKQKQALEKITGRVWDTWQPEAVRAYFAFTDRGRSVEVSSEAMADFNELMSQHHWHSVIVEIWKEEFRVGLLFLDDFIGKDYPEAYVKHALEVYQDTMGYIPSKYRKKPHYQRKIDNAN